MDYGIEVHQHDFEDLAGTRPRFVDADGETMVRGGESVDVSLHHTTTLIRKYFRLVADPEKGPPTQQGSICELTNHCNY